MTARRLRNFGSALVWTSLLLVPIRPVAAQSTDLQGNALRIVDRAAVLVIDIETGQVLSRFPTGPGPDGVAYSPIVVGRD